MFETTPYRPPVAVLVLNETAPVLRRVLFNLKGPAKPRYETLEGRQHLVVPVVMLAEGVVAGSGGPLFYENEDIASTVSLWDHKPIVVNHPSFNGVGISACDPAVLDAQKIGIMLNTKADPKLRSEAWLDVELVKKVDERVLQRVLNGQVVEVSTGLYCEVEEKDGIWNGTSYTGVARRYRPDHLAVLPDSVGAFSVADGGGLLRNEASFDATRTLLCCALREDSSEYCYVTDVFKQFFVYEKNMKMWKQNYTATDTSATLVGEPVEVVRVVQYRTPDGSVVANYQQNVEDDVDRKKTIDKLIGNGKGTWGEDERPWLEKQTDKKLSSLLKNQESEEELAKRKEEEAKKAADPAPKDEKKVEEAPKLPVVGNAKPATFEELLANASPELQATLRAGMRAHVTEKKRLITTITANKRNRFTEETLNRKDLEELQALAELAQETPVAAQPMSNFLGMGDAYTPPIENRTNEEALGLPTTYDVKKA